MPKILLTKKEWLEKGLESFGCNGLPGLAVEKMAHELGCSKSSFYWYFNTKDEYLHSLVKYWQDVETLSFIKDAEKEKTPSQKFYRLFMRAGKADLRMDFLYHLRNLAQKNKKFLEVLNEIEEQRIGYVQSLLEQMGENKGDAREKAELIYNHCLGWYERRKNQPRQKKEIERAIASVVRLLNIKLSRSFYVDKNRKNQLSFQ